MVAQSTALIGGRDESYALIGHTVDRLLSVVGGNQGTSDGNPLNWILSPDIGRPCYANAPCYMRAKSGVVAYLAAMGLSCVVCGWCLWSETRHTLRPAAHSVLGAAPAKMAPGRRRTPPPQRAAPPPGLALPPPGRPAGDRSAAAAGSLAVWGCGGGRVGSVSQRKAEAAVEAASSSRAFHIDPAPQTG